MAREFAQIKLSIWADDDWRDLSPDARYLYLTLLTSPTLTHCGTADWRPARLSAVNGQARDVIEDAGAEMVNSLHILIDEETEEVLIRSFIRNDGLMKQPKMAVAMASAHAGVASATLRGVVVHEAKRLRDDFPNLHGWGAERAIELLGMRSVDPSTYPLGKGSRKGKPTPISEGSVKGSPTPTPTTTPTDSRLTPSTDVAISTANAVGARDGSAFDAFWDAYGKKVGRGAAEKAWAKATKHTDAEVIIRAAGEHAAWHERSRTEPRFIPHPTTWLNEKRWADERTDINVPQRANGDIDWEAAMQRAKARDERGAV
jgi:hypothetical protein